MSNLHIHLVPLCYGVLETFENHCKLEQLIGIIGKVTPMKEVGNWKV